MKFAKLSEATYVNVEDISHIHVVADSANKTTNVHIFMRGNYPQARVIIRPEEFAALELEILVPA